MNILIICHYGLYKDLTSSFVHNQLRELAALGNRVRIIVPNGLGKVGPDGKKVGKLLSKREADCVEIFDLRHITLSSYGKKGLNAFFAKLSLGLCINKISQDFTPDVIHAHTLGFDSNLGKRLSKRFSCPLVVTTHGSDTEVPLAQGHGAWLKKQADKADLIVSVSNKLSKKLASCQTNTKIVTVHNGFVPHKLPSSVKKDPLSIIQVGHLIESKRNEVTIRAFAKLKKTHPQMSLTIIGEGKLRNRLFELCRELGVEDSVTFTGQLPNFKVFAEMCRSAYFVMASKPEGFGIVYLEAMAAGCVTVGTVGEGIADIISSGENGFLVEADDAEAIVSVIEKCIADTELYEKISANGKATALSLDWSVNAKKHSELYSTLMQAKTEI